MINFKKVFSTTKDVSEPEQLQRALTNMQTNIEDAFTSLQTGTVLDSVIINDVIINTSKSLSHKLGRLPLGYIIIKRSANAQIWNGSITSSSIALVSSANVTVSLLVF